MGQMDKNNPLCAFYHEFFLLKIKIAPEYVKIINPGAIHVNIVFIFIPLMHRLQSNQSFLLTHPHLIVPDGFLLFVFE